MQYACNYTELDRRRILSIFRPNETNSASDPAQPDENENETLEQTWSDPCWTSLIIPKSAFYALNKFLNLTLKAHMKSDILNDYSKKSKLNTPFQ